MGFIADLKKLICNHIWVLKVDDKRMRERVYKCENCAAIKSVFYDEGVNGID